jgi:hypothetical protein
MGSAASGETARIARANIRALLAMHIEQPHFNAREKDYQAHLFGSLRHCLPCCVPVKFSPRPKRSHTWQETTTSRVHTEMYFGKKGSKGSWTRSDLVVLRDNVVELRCSRDGPTDTQEHVREQDVELVIELKSAPSRNEGEARKFARDVAKLARVQSTSRHIHCFAVVVDKSVSTPHSQSDVRPRDWLTGIDERFHRFKEPPDEPHVEVWYVDPSFVSPAASYFALRSASNSPT